MDKTTATTTTTTSPTKLTITAISKLGSKSGSSTTASRGSEHKKSAIVGASQQEGGYEKVRPPTRDEELEDSWASESVSFGKRWYKSQEQRKRKMTLVKVFICFAIFLAVLIVAIAGGFYYMVRYRTRRRHDSGIGLTTKTTGCRKKHSKKEMCVFESEDEYSECVDDVCVELSWKFDLDANTGVARFVENINKLPLSPEFTERTDCGYLDWCKDGVCVPSHQTTETWWPAGDYPFPPSSSSGTWIDLAQSNHPCVEPSRNLDQLISNYWEKCNSTICSQPGLSFGIRIVFRACDSNADLTIGYLH